MIGAYFDQIRKRLDRIEARQAAGLELAAAHTAESLIAGGIVHLFGCGHSHILTEEVFYRAGGLVPIRPIFYEPLMLHEGALRSSELERENGLAETFMRDQDIRPGEVAFVLSTSGRNPVPVDAARIAREKGAFAIGITSLEYSNSQPSRHSSGSHLFDAVDLVLDNYSAVGDAVLRHPEIPVPFTPTSTVIGAAMLNAIFARSAVIMAERGFEPPVFLSGNIDGADRRNLELVERYRERIPLLR
ncbi:hypothetical protein CDO73_03275 [Saccharibacillus sp. O23]|uniref:SIS domain-containing protein n=1 Tax=Saccharibacillus sp. O23 TaxID=2009338 RepID=UPI000B4E7981|nr:SIS domain-containing protein [Saccharibacillus sp. O23]OWR32636.1 hypothetical protein CDO73_03275 [Saccharibacillus sp. O23]